MLGDSADHDLFLRDLADYSDDNLRAPAPRTEPLKNPADRPVLEKLSTGSAIQPRLSEPSRWWRWATWIPVNSARSGTW